MEHLASHFKELGPWALTVMCGLLLRVLHQVKVSVRSLGETRFKADEAHEEVCAREPEYQRRFDTWKAHRKPF